MTYINIIRIDTLQTLMKVMNPPMALFDFYLMIYCRFGFRMTTAADMNTAAITSAECDKQSEIQSFYNGATVFLTGATGFLGNLIMEKLLR